MHDPHNRDQKLENNLEKLEAGNFSDSNVRIIKEFCNAQFSQNVSAERVSRHVSSFNSLQELIDFDLEDADRGDVQQLVLEVNQDMVGDMDHSPWTINEYRKTIKKFYQWLTSEEDPEIVDFISVYVPKSDRSRTDPDQLPTPKQVREIKDEFKNTRDPAFLSVLYKTGGRISEILNLKWKDINEFEEYTKVNLRVSKTFPRRVPVVDCLEELERWKEDHVDPSPESYIFTHLGDADPATYSGMYRQVQRASRRAEVDCDTNFHAFRKARATWMASKGMNTHYLMQMFGWDKPETTMEYVRLAHRDLEDAFLRIVKDDGSKRSEGDRRRCSSPPIQRPVRR